MTDPIDVDLLMRNVVRKLKGESAIIRVIVALAKAFLRAVDNSDQGPFVLFDGRDDGPNFSTHPEYWKSGGIIRDTPPKDRQKRS
jgi:hypothetical protein